MATVVARLEAILSAQTRDFERDMKKAEAQTTGFGKTLGKAKVAAAGFAIGGIALATEVMKKSVEAAMEAQKTQARLDQSFRAAHLSVSHYEKDIEGVEKRSRRLGFTNNDVRLGLGTLITATGSYKESVKQLAVAQDLSRFKQVSLADATKALAMLHAGSTRALKQLGLQVVRVTEAEDKVHAAFKKHSGAAYDAALATAKLEDKQKTAQKTMEIVTQKVHGQADAYSKTLAGAIDQFRAQLENVEVQIGTKLLPVLTSAIQYILKNWPKISEVIQQGWQQIQPTLKSLMQLVGEVVAFVRRHWSTIGPIVTDVANIIKTELKIIGDVFKLFTDLLRGDWSKVWQDLKKLASLGWQQLKNIFKYEKDVLVGILSGIGTAIADVFRAAWPEIKKGVSWLFHKIVGWIWDFLKPGSGSKVFKSIGQNMIQGLIDGVGSMAGALKTYVIKVAESVPRAVTGAVIGGVTGGFMGTRVSGGGNQTNATRLGQRIIDQEAAHGSSHVVALVDAAVGYAYNKGWRGRVTSAWRSYAEQSALYQRHLHGGPLAAPPGHSSHESGQAVDVTDYANFGRIMARAPSWARLHNYLGGADPVHYSVSGYDRGGWLPTGLSLAYNATGQPERVLGPGEGGDVIHVHQYQGPVVQDSKFLDYLRQLEVRYRRRNNRPAFGGI